MLILYSLFVAFLTVYIAVGLIAGTPQPFDEPRRPWIRGEWWYRLGTYRRSAVAAALLWILAADSGFGLWRTFRGAFRELIANSQMLEVLIGQSGMGLLLGGMFSFVIFACTSVVGLVLWLVEAQAALEEKRRREGW